MVSRRKIKLRRKRLMKVSVVILVLCSFIFLGIKASGFVLGKDTIPRISFSGTGDFNDAAEPLAFDSSELYSENAILISLEDMAMIYEKNSDARIYPASLTKILTALVALEEIDDLDAFISVPTEIFGKIYSTHASVAGFLPGEQITARDLIYGIMLPSGADASLTIAAYAASSEDEFVDLMNVKAKKIAMNHSHFTNVSGVQDSNHYTTVKDMAILLSYALNNRDFYEIFTSYRHSISSTNLHPEGITLVNTLFGTMATNNINCDYILGGKTGYTSEAGLCLASLGKVNGKKHLLVTAAAPSGDSSRTLHILDAVNLYNQVGGIR